MRREAMMRRGETMRRSGRVRVAVSGLLVAALAALGLALVSSVGWAQERDTLLRALQSRSFRVRVQAAFALGNAKDPTVRSALEGSLRDRHQAVRAAAATALGKLGAPEAIPALERARHDRDGAVRMQVERSLRALREIASKRRGRRGAAIAAGGVYPSIRVTAPAGTISWPRVRYAVFLGDMRDASGFRGDDLASMLRLEIERQLQLLRGVAVFPHGRADENAERQIRSRKVTKMRIEGNVTELQRKAQRRELAVRCVVSLMLLDEPERNMRGILTGAATGKGVPRRTNRSAQERDLAAQALSGAVRSAMGNIPTALAQVKR